MSPIAPELVSYCNPSEVRAQSTRKQSNAGTIFCNHVDCGGIAGSMQSHCNPVATCHNSIFRPMARPTSAKSQHKLSDPVTIVNPHAIKLKCDGIAKVQRIAIWLIGLHKNCTDCRQIAATVRLDEGSTAIPTGFGQMTRSGLFPAVQSAIHQKPGQS